MSRTTAAAKQSRRPGRPRSARADAAIAAATLQLLFRHGYANLAIEEVANHAGVSKATIYRRYPSKLELVIAAISVIGPADQEPPDTGSFAGDFLAITGGVAASSDEAQAPMLALPRIAAEAAATDPELFEALRERLLEPRFRLLRAVIERGVERGELRADLDVQTVIDMLMGPLMFLAIRTGRGWNHEPESPRRVLETLLDGIRAG